MNKFVAIEFIPRLGNVRPENGTETQTFQSVRSAELHSAVFNGGTRAVASQLLIAML